jgi:O-antigen ligase
LGLFFAWAGWLGFSAIWAPVDARVSETLLDVVLLVAFTMTSWTLMRLLPSDVVNRVWKWLVFIALIYFVLAAAAGPGVQGRYAAPGGGPNVFVRVMILGAIASFYFASTKKKIWPLVPVPLFAIGAALSGSRGGILSAAVVLLFFAFPIAKKLGAGRVVMLGLGVVVGALVILFRDDGVLARFVQERYIQQTLVEQHSSGRDTITADGLRLYGENPIIGTGLDGYFALQRVPEQFEYPHNLFIATMAESGSIGLVLLLAAILALTPKRRPIPTSAFFAVLAGLYLGIASLFSGDYYDTRLMWFFLGLAAVEAAKERNSPDKLQPSGPEKEGYRSFSTAGPPRSRVKTILPIGTRRL